MNAGEPILDTQGQSWILDAPLGRGLWGRTWSVRRAPNPGRDGKPTAADALTHAVLKVPLTASDFAGDADAEALADAARTLADAHRRLLTDRAAQRAPAFLPVPVAFAVQGPGVFLKRYGADLEARLQAGSPLSDLIDILVRATHAIASGAVSTAVHGNLRPTNVFVGDDERVVLTDPWLGDAGPGCAEAWGLLTRHAARAHAPAHNGYLPPEAHPASAPQQRLPLATTSWDTWAICQMLYRAARVPASSDDPRRGLPVELPQEGLSRADQAAVRDAATARLRAEGANQRFCGRATEKLGTVLSRGLSPQTEPSPPYRFRAAGDLLPRLVEVDDLIHPAVESVSKPLLATRAVQGVFDAGQPVEFAINVGTTAGVTAQEDIATGVQLRDLDAAGGAADTDAGRVRVPNARFNVKKYPSGRWRFNFELPDIAPGRYGLRVVFAIKGSDAVSQVAEGSFQVRPAAGYVPPQITSEPPSPPLTLQPVTSASAAAPTAPGPRAVDASALRAERRPEGEVVPLPGRTRTPASAPQDPFRGLGVDRGEVDLIAEEMAPHGRFGARVPEAEGPPTPIRPDPNELAGYDPYDATVATRSPPPVVPVPVAPGRPAHTAAPPGTGTTDRSSEPSGWRPPPPAVAPPPVLPTVRPSAQGGGLPPAWDDGLSQDRPGTAPTGGHVPTVVVGPPGTPASARVAGVYPAQPPAVGASPGSPSGADFDLDYPGPGSTLGPEADWAGGQGGAPGAKGPQGLPTFDGTEAGADADAPRTGGFGLPAAWGASWEARWDAWVKASGLDSVTLGAGLATGAMVALVLLISLLRSCGS